MLFRPVLAAALLLSTAAVAQDVTVEPAVMGEARRALAEEYAARIIAEHEATVPQDVRDREVLRFKDTPRKEQLERNLIAERNLKAKLAIAAARANGQLGAVTEPAQPPVVTSAQITEERLTILRAKNLCASGLTHPEVKRACK